MSNRQILVVRSGFGSLIPTTGLAQFTDEISVIFRRPRKHIGWKSVFYKRDRFQLHGGICTPLFICTNNPIKGFRKVKL